MKLKRILEDDDAVSPVIGVILMVAITVILAAVIATFVLGLGEQISETSPNASFTFDYQEVGSDTDSWGVTSTDAVINITHSGGPNINAEQLGITGSSIGTHSSNSPKWAFDTSSSPYSTSPYSTGTEISAGDSVDYGISSSDRIRVVWENEDGTESATLQNYRGPDA